MREVCPCLQGSYSSIIRGARVLLTATDDDDAPVLTFPRSVLQAGYERSRKCRKRRRGGTAGKACDNEGHACSRGTHQWHEYRDTAEKARGDDDYDDVQELQVLALVAQVACINLLRL